MQYTVCLSSQYKGRGWGNFVTFRKQRLRDRPCRLSWVSRHEWRGHLTKRLASYPNHKPNLTLWRDFMVRSFHFTLVPCTSLWTAAKPSRSQRCAVGSSPGAWVQTAALLRFPWHSAHAVSPLPSSYLGTPDYSWAYGSSAIKYTIFLKIRSLAC